MLRSLGKFFGLAGLRVGFLLGAPDALATVASWLGPWTISGPAQHLATCALTDTAWQQQMLASLPKQSAQLAQLLTQHGLTPLGGSDLFQYVRHPHSRALHHALAQQGVWTRLFDAPLALRFGLPPASDWPRLAQALTAVMPLDGH